MTLSRHLSNTSFPHLLFADRADFFMDDTKSQYPKPDPEFIILFCKLIVKYAPGFPGIHGPGGRVNEIENSQGRGRKQIGISGD
jgi:hypothetical protein